MKVQFLNEGTEFRSYGGSGMSKNKPGSGLFWWTLAITLMVGLAIISWFFCIFVFSRPENPFSYRVLTKVNKLEPLRKYSPLTVPQGKFHSARDLLGEYFPLDEEHLSVANDVLKRGYIRNYKSPLAPQYVKGSFVVTAMRALTAEDVFTNGWVAHARAEDIEDVEIEIVLPEATNADPFKVGETITLDQRNTFASAVHVQKLAEDRLRVTVVPLAYQGIGIEGTLMNAPDKLNLDARWPVASDLNSTGDIPSKVAAQSGS
jgi:hypothetical protein